MKKIVVSVTNVCYRCGKSKTVETENPGDLFQRVANALPTGWATRAVKYEQDVPSKKVVLCTACKKEYDKAIGEFGNGK